MYSSALYLLFDGWVIRPSFEPVDSVIALECSDRLQDAIEALSIAGVDALVGGNWSADPTVNAGSALYAYAHSTVQTYLAGRAYIRHG
ncbi:hypothetical protein A471_23073 [Ectopseudomonas mendocina DLHK]|nr:hypothetical protein A471_23073 [Pseudomonas mendocina DLHK]